MSVNMVNIATWVNSPVYRSYKAHRINFITQECTTGLKPHETVDHLHVNLRSLTAATDKPTRFVAVLLAFSVADDLVTASEEWANSPLEEFSGGSTCICSHNITYEYYLRNVENGNVLSVGCDCVQKVPFPDHVKDKIKEQRKIKVAMDKNISYKRCIRCLDKVIPEQSTENYCKTCKPLIPPIIPGTIITAAPTTIIPAISVPAVPQQITINKRVTTQEIDTERELRRQEYCRQWNLSPEYQAKLNLYLEDRKKPPSERIYV